MSEMGSSATVEVDVAGEEIVIRISGELDLTNIDVLDDALGEEQQTPGPMVFDLGELEFMDSSALAVLLKVVAGGRTVRLRNPKTVIREVLEATGLTDVLQVEM